MLFRKRDAEPIGPHQPAMDLDEYTARSEFLLTAVKALLVFAKDFSLESKEIQAEDYRLGIDAFTDTLDAGMSPSRLASRFETQKSRIAAHIVRQKTYIREREDGLKDIIDLLTKAMVSLDSDNRVFNEKVFAQSEKIENLTCLDDIRQIRTALANEVALIRKTIHDKQDSDSRRMEGLSQKVQSLNAELKQARDEAQIDALTLVSNRRAFDAYLCNRIRRNAVERVAFALLMIDIDQFKAINDTYGHRTGDRILCSVASKCAENARSNDFLARHGGDEFVMVLPGASLRNAVKKARTICKTIARTRYLLERAQESVHFSVTVSIGASSFRPEDTADSVVERADKALYAAKHKGRNRAVSEKEI